LKIHARRIIDVPLKTNFAVRASSPIDALRLDSAVSQA